MPRLTSLKNNDKGRAELQSMRGDRDPVSWLSEVLGALAFQEKDAPWKKLLLISMEDDLRSLAGSRNPLLRLHACASLIHSDNEKILRILWDLFKDSSREIRIFLAGKMASSDRHRIYNTLFRLYLNDPVLDVRKAAYGRIKKDFSDLYTVQPAALSVSEKIHCLELLETSSSHDHNLALEFMKDPQPGVVLSASLYLEKSGTLDSMIKKARLRDMDDLERRAEVLKRAADHSIVSFLQKKENLDNPGSLYLALTIFEEGTGSRLFAWTLEKIFALGESKRFFIEMKQRALRCLSDRRDPDTLLLIRDLLKTDKNRGIIVPWLLENLPSEGSPVYYPVLKEFLLNREFPYWDSLVKAFKRITLCTCLSDFFTLVMDTSLNMEIRRRALVLLAGYREYSSTLFLMEHLDLMTGEDMKALAPSVQEWNKEVFTSNVVRIFKEPDARLHQGLMELLSASGNREFISQIEEGLQSPVAGTRISALHALRQLDSRDSTDMMKGLFYDGQPGVQAECAAVFIDWNREECFDEVHRLLKDGFEENSLHKIILNGAAESDNYKLLPLLTALFE
ncbi:MAG: HEAT repeat domain-containing protein, partial [Spirochaetales bacterium]|nr:HEAT repeat domain-containing protein [Spirochaetales bacterium]